MRAEMLDEYRRLIPEVPYIGDCRNIYSKNMVHAPWALALYRWWSGTGAGAFEGAFAATGHPVATSMFPGSFHEAFRDPQKMPEIVDLIVDVAHAPTE